MPRSSKKSVQSQTHNIQVNNHCDINSVVNDDKNYLKKKKKKRRNSTLIIENSHQPTIDNVQVYIQTSVTESRIIYLSRCPCDVHYNKLLIEHDYNLSADRVFDLIFGSNEFVRTYRLNNKLYDMVESEWLRNEEENCLERVLNYKVPFETKLLGKTTITTRENQKRIHEVPGSHYVVETEVFNEGVKFSDTFSLIIRFCIVQISPITTKLLVTARIQYIKSVNGFIKQFIERSSYSASQNGLKDLNVRLNALQNSSRELNLTNGMTASADSTTANNHQINQQDLSLTNRPQTASVATTVPDNNNTNINLNRSISSSDRDQVMHILMFMVGILCLIHLYLYNKLQQTDILLDTLIHLLKK